MNLRKNNESIVRSIYLVGYILSFTFLPLIISGIRNTIVNGYEADLYSNTPSYVWILIIIVYIYGSLTLISTSSCNKDYNRKYFIISFLLLLFLNSIILLIPRIKYPVMWDRWDSWYHLGYTLDILSTYHINTLLNPYPGLHILEAFLISITGIKLDDLFALTVPLLFSSYPIFMYILSRKLGLNETQRSWVVCFSILFPYISVFETATPLGFITTIPFSFATFFIPVIMILVFSENSDSMLLIIILMFAITISHMITAICATFGFLAMNIFKLVHKTSRIHDNVKNVKDYLPFLGFVLIVTWLIYLTNVYKAPTRNIFDAMLFGNTVGVNFKDAMSDVGINGFDQVILLLKIITPSLIIVFLSIFAVKGIIANINKEPRVYMLFVLIGWFVSSSISFIAIAALFSNLPFSPFRLLGMEFVLLPVMAGYALRIEIKDNTISKIGFLILLVIFFTPGLFAKYPSPYTGSNNYQTTEHEISGIKWIDSLKNRSIEYAGSNYNRAILAGNVGYENISRRADFGITLMSLPENLGYSNFSIYDQQMRNKYVLLSRFDTEVYSRKKLFKSDVDSIETDENFNKIFNNNGYNVYFYKFNRMIK